MNRNYLKTIEDIVNSAKLLMTSVIPQSEGKHDIYYSIEYALKGATEFAQAITKNRKIKDLRYNLSNVLASMKPAAIRVTVYESEAKAHTSFETKLDDVYVPVIDERHGGQKRQEPNIINTELEDLTGLGMLGKIEINRLNDKINSIKERYEERLTNEKNNLQQSYNFDKFQLQTQLNSLTEKNKNLEHELSELKQEAQEVGMYALDLEEELRKKGSDLNKIKDFGIAGVVGKMLGYDKEEISGLLGLMNSSSNDEMKQLPPDKDAELITEEVINPERKEAIDIIITYLYKTERNNYLKIIDILKAIESDRELSDKIIEFIAKKEEEEENIDNE